MCCHFAPLYHFANLRSLCQNDKVIPWQRSTYTVALCGCLSICNALRVSTDSRIDCVANREGKKRRAFATNIKREEKMPEIEAKPQETIEWILECVSDNLLFLKLDRDQKERVVQRMQLITVKKDHYLIQQGDTNAQTFYVTESGTFDILVDGVKVGQYKRGGCFGELALLYDSPRAASILVEFTDNVVWCRHRV